MVSDSTWISPEPEQPDARGPELTSGQGGQEADANWATNLGTLPDAVAAATPCGLRAWDLAFCRSRGGQRHRDTYVAW